MLAFDLMYLMQNQPLQNLEMQINIVSKVSHWINIGVKIFPFEFLISIGISSDTLTNNKLRPDFNVLCQV